MTEQPEHGKGSADGDPNGSPAPANDALYLPPIMSAGPVAALAQNLGTRGEARFVFADQITIGRYRYGERLVPGTLLIDDPTVSSRHCVITRTTRGRFQIRDVSRNGTRVDGRRLVPNIEFELRIGQRIEVGTHHEFVLVAETARSRRGDATQTGDTLAAPVSGWVTVLVGDIRHYTMLVQQVPPERLQPSVSHLFSTLEKEISRMGGTVKEYLGDAVFAFWEKGAGPRSAQAAAACRAALALDDLVGRVARSAAAGPGNCTLAMDWALATGPVTIDSLGGDRPKGLSMVGESVVLAFRLEKLANERTGRILACAQTAREASPAFLFRSLGPMRLEGFDQPEEVFALVGERR